MIEHDTRSQIMLAAEARFTQYGYGKTTMAEISADCNMSAANLYRYFESKLDIGAALAHRCLIEKEEGLTLIITDDSKSPSDKLHQFILHILHHTYHYFEERPRIHELIEVIALKRPELMIAHSESTLHLLHQLLELSVQSGEFTVANIDETAEAISVAIIPFYLPATMSLHSLEEFEGKAHIVCQLLLNGLIKH